MFELNVWVAFAMMVKDIDKKIAPHYKSFVLWNPEQNKKRKKKSKPESGFESWFESASELEYDPNKFQVYMFGNEGWIAKHSKWKTHQAVARVASARRSGSG